jgi:hypothetical protein
MATDNNGKNSHRIIKSIILGLLALFLLVLVFVLGKIIADSYKGDSSQTEIIMGIVVVGAIVAMMTILYILAVGFKFMKLADKQQALGLPEGSIRAMIALILIMAFIIFGIYLFRNVGYGFSVVLQDSIPPASLKSVNLDKYRAFKGTISIERENGDTTYAIVGVNKVSDDGSKLAQQLLTTAGTLVVAISSFYFGSTSITNALSKLGGTGKEAPGQPKEPMRPAPDQPENSKDPNQPAGPGKPVQPKPEEPEKPMEPNKQELPKPEEHEKTAV